jgi:beta-lactamase class A
MTALFRRQALLAAAAASVPAPAPADPADPLAGFDERIGAIERRHGAYVGLFAVDLEGCRSISHRGQEASAMCSTFKGYASARVLQMVEQGALTLDHEVFIDPAEIVANSPRTQPRAGGDMTLDELCQAALQVSSRLDRWETALNSAVGSTNDVGVAYDPAGRRVPLAMTTRSQVNDPKAQNLCPLIAELTTLVIPALLA